MRLPLRYQTCAVTSSRPKMDHGALDDLLETGLGWSPCSLRISSGPGHELQFLHRVPGRRRGLHNGDPILIVGEG